jgi:hypothetical protein
MPGTEPVRDRAHGADRYPAGRTGRIVAQLPADGVTGLTLCTAEEVAVHPIPGKPVDFVRGDPAAAGVLARAAVHRAATVLVDMADDNEALAVDHANPAADAQCGADLPAVSEGTGAGPRRVIKPSIA